MAESTPFEVELHLGAGIVVPFKLWEDRLRDSRDPTVAGIAVQIGGREGAREAGVAMVERAVTRNLDEPLHIEDGDTLWIIPARSVQVVRFRDPTIKRGPSKAGMSFGFSADRLGGSGSE